MKKFKLFAFITLIAINVVACSDEPAREENRQGEDIILSRAEQDIVEAQAAFAWRLLEASLKSNDSKDILYSPLCIEMALNMTANGMGERSLNELLKALEVSDLNTLNTLNKTLLDKLPMCDPKGAEVNMFFSNWQDAGTEFNPSFATSLKQLFGVPTLACDFGSNDMMSIVNKWAKDNTNGMIDVILTEKPDDLTVMLLCNSIYFNGKWKYAFEKNQTQIKDFKDSYGKTTGKASMMQYSLTKDESFTYTQFETYKQAGFPYGNGSFKLNIYLPEEGKTILDMVESISSNPKMNYNSFVYSPTEVLIPRFEIGTRDTVSKILEYLGINLNEGDYSGISNQLKSIKMIQASQIKVDEEGTTAASVTVQQGMDTALPPAQKKGDFIADRPFVYTITGPYNTVLFVGTMSNPGVK